MNKRRKGLQGLVLGTVLLLLAGCAGTAHIEKDDSVDFSRYRTYSWVEAGTKHRDQKNDLAEAKIRKEVDAELAKEGWKKSDNAPDVLLSYDLLVERSSKKVNDPVYSRSYVRTFYNPYTRRFFNVYYPSQFLGYDNYEVPVRAGTITISMIDTKTDKTVWQGWSTEEINNRNITSREIQNGVRAIFRKFDVAKK